MASLEDVTKLECLIKEEMLNSRSDIHKLDWKKVMDDFQIKRKPNTDAINHLAKGFMEGTRKKVYDSEFRERKQIIDYLTEHYAQKFMSQYQLIEFSDIDFVKALTFGKVESEIVRQIRMIPNYQEIIKKDSQNTIVRQILKSYQGKYDLEQTAVEII